MQQFCIIQYFHINHISIPLTKKAFQPPLIKITNFAMCYLAHVQIYNSISSMLATHWIECKQQFIRYMI